MAANSLPRRLLKKLLHPFLGERHYQLLQSLAMAWDIRAGSYPEPELRLIPVAVRPGDTVLDIGANYGFYTYHLSRAVGSSGRVYAFEPVPFTRGVLERVAKLLRFRNVRVVPKGCGDRPGRFAFVVPVQNSGALSAGLAFMRRGEGDSRQARQPDGGREVWCEVVTVDEFLPGGTEISFIKCDIEGAELLAFVGAERTISRHLPTVLCEINEGFLERSGVRLEDLTGFFFSKGYKMYRYDGAASRLTEVVTLGNNLEGNYVFIHPLRGDLFAHLHG